jgi:bifunctional DNA-binding transcriptional regulator/antitoxin component of YhaV-PrlF toxin-antitoxin module
VGRKGELFPPKSIRQEAGLKAGDEVTFEASEGSIRVQRVPTLREAFSQKKFAKVTFKQFEEMTSKVLSSSSI